MKSFDANHSESGPRGSAWRGVVVCTGLLAILLLGLTSFVSPVHSQCVIEGVSTVDPDQAYTLCGPRGSGYSYQWNGPGISSSRTARCVSVPGRASGMYEYTLSVFSGGVELDRCAFVVNVEGGSPTDSEDICDIVGPSEMEAGAVVELCGTPSSFDVRSYSWTGPAGFSASSRCVSVTRPGVYQLTTRNSITGHVRRCTHQITSTYTEPQRCAISGPTSVNTGESARLCAPSTGTFTYRWTGPGGFLSSSQCVTVTRAGSYTLTLRHRTTGEVVRCTHALGLDEGPDDSGDIVSDNCPHNAAYWSGACGNRNELSVTELRTVARLVDERSASFDWSNDVDGFCKALRPAAPITRRKQASQQLATLMANLIAREMGLRDSRGEIVGIDPDTPVSVQSVNTVGELAALLDRMLARTRGNFAGINRQVAAVNAGRGIGPVCP